jgi:hypothetical protein
MAKPIPAVEPVTKAFLSDLSQMGTRSSLGCESSG